MMIFSLAREMDHTDSIFRAKNQSSPLTCLYLSTKLNLVIFHNVLTAVRIQNLADHLECIESCFFIPHRLSWRGLITKETPPSPYLILDFLH
jgi:hypothetical protein